MHLPVNLLIPIIIAAAVLAALVIVYVVALRPGAQLRRALGRRARIDFESARGAVHLELMCEARNRLEADERREQSALASAKRLKAGWAAGRDDQLRAALEDHVLDTKLRTIPGVGQWLETSLQVYAKSKGGLNALRHAEGHVPGIGPTRQMEIIFWLDALNGRMPDLLAGDFPGKAVIIAQAATELAELDVEIQKRTSNLAGIRAQLDKLKEEIEPLGQVTLAAFRQALEDPQAATEAVERYMRGAFAEWEPVPDWFKEVVGGVAE